MSQTKPTRVRHLVVGAAFLMSVVLYLHRFCVSMAQTYIQQDLGLTNAQVGWMLSAFFWTYALGQVPSGWLTDRFGSRRTLTAYILLWSLFTGLTGAASAFMAVLALRLGSGLSQSGAYPTAASIVSKWVPFESRGLASGIISMGGRVGAVLAMYVTGFLLVLLTPMSTRTELDSDDLIDARRLCYTLAGQPNPTTTTENDGESRKAEESKKPSTADQLNEACLTRFSSATQPIVRRLAQQYADDLQAKKDKLKSEGKSSKDAVPDKVEIPAEDARQLVEQLNGLIAGETFITAEQSKNVSLEKEARRLLSDQDQLSDQKGKRLNRLVLEGLHPKTIKKLYIAGWRPMMYLYGSLGILVAAVVWWTCHKSPQAHPRCNEAEAKLIAGTDKLPESDDNEPKTVQAVPLGRLVKSFSMWMCCLTQWFTNIGWAFLMLLAPRYFTVEHNLSIETVATLSALPPIAGGLGMFCGGPVTDRLVRIVGLRWGRVLPISLSRFVCMGAYIVCLSNPGPTTAVIMFAAVAFFTGIGTPAMWAFNQDVGGKYVGSVLGWGNMWGNFGAAVTGPLLMSIAGSPERWTNVFATCAGAFLLSGLVAFGVNATISIAPEEK